MPKFKKRDVNLSQFHAGQIVTPWVTEEGLGHGVVEVVIGQVDASEPVGSSGRNVETARRRFRDSGIARRWVAGHGVLLDDSRTWL